MDIRISHNIGGSEYKVFEQKNGCDLCHKTGDEEQKVYYFKDGKGPFDKPPFDPTDWA